MLSGLKNHPFGVEAHFDHSIVLSWATRPAALRLLLPPCLEPDVYDGKWGFVAAAFVKTRSLRPVGFPKNMGNDFYLAGYRIFVRYRTANGKRLRGLYILGSETNSRQMQWLGSLFTHYRYQLSDIGCLQNGTHFRVQATTGIDVSVTKAENNIALPAGSPFATWKEARRFAGPLPFTFSWYERRKKVLIVQGLRENWEPIPLEIHSSRVDFISHLGLPELQLANGFIVENIPYQWAKGRTEIWQENEGNLLV